jgi:hypothetical protein
LHEAYVSGLSTINLKLPICGLENGRVDAIIRGVSFSHIVCTGHLNFRWKLVERFFTAETPDFGLPPGSGFRREKTA